MEIEITKYVQQMITIIVEADDPHHAYAMNMAGKYDNEWTDATKKAPVTENTTYESSEENGQ